jgi:CDP-archaeol synthase
MAVFEVQALADDLGFLRELALIGYSDHPVQPGLLISFGALAGDSIKSFFKRQIGIRSGASWLVFDQLVSSSERRSVFSWYSRCRCCLGSPCCRLSSFATSGSRQPHIGSG